MDNVVKKVKVCSGGSWTASCCQTYGILEKVQLMQLHSVVYFIVTWVQMPINTEMALIAQLVTNIFIVCRIWEKRWITVKLKSAYVKYK